MSTSTAVIVDDDEAVARGLMAMLVRLGYQVHVTHDPESGLAAVRELRPDVALLDINLCNTRTGIDIARELANDEVPILLMTGMDEIDLSPLSDIGAIGFVTKPVNRAALRANLELIRMQHRSRLELRRMKRHYQLLFDQAAVGVLEVALSGHVLELNRRCGDIFGFSVTDMVNVDLVGIVDPEFREPLREAFAMLATGQLREHAVEISGCRSDGQPVWVRMTATPLAGTPDRDATIVCTVQDITERERESSARRESENRERIALEANRAKTDFLAHMSHELRTPLNAVLGLSEAMLERIFGDLTDAQTNTLTTIHTSGKHLLDLINDLLDIARVESGKLLMDPEQVVLRPLIDESTSLMSSQLAAKRQRLVIELAPALPPVDVDKRRIKQVLINLLGNASKFSPVGAIVTMRVTADAARREVELAIADNGPGIAESDRERIFEPFVTVDPSMTRSHDGAGLGLALTRQIVELHGGRIRVNSELGKGATFTISLPVSTTYAGELHRPTASRQVAPPPAHGVVLLAEDNEATVLAVSTYLQSQGYEIRVVGDGLSALAAAAERDVRLVLMDVQLPGLDGLEVTRRLREQHVDKPIVALTAHAMPGDQRRCLDAGASAYMAKPVRLRALADTISQLLEARRALGVPS